MSIETPLCKKCGVKLTDVNWYPSNKKWNRRICNKCKVEQGRLWKLNNLLKPAEYCKRWRDRNPAAVIEGYTKDRIRRGGQTMKENKTCSQYLGIHVAERVLSRVFKDVTRMHLHNHGYDFICNHGKKIDVKSSCIVTHTVNGTEYQSWKFNIRHNQIADFFLCLAFDNRADLNPLHVWMLPGCKYNHFAGIGISSSTVDKWNEYELPIDEIMKRCDSMKER